MCLECGMRFTRRQHVLRHTSVVHCPVKPRTHACTECGKTYTRVELLQRHCQLHKTVTDTIPDTPVNSAMKPTPHDVNKPRLHTCTECGKSFTRKYHLWRHFRVHKGVTAAIPGTLLHSATKSITPYDAEHYSVKLRLHECMECGKGFTRKYHLLRHLQVHKRGKGAVPCSSVNSTVVESPLCNSVVSSAAPLPCALVQNAVKPAPCVSVRYTVKPRLHMCMECGKSFTRKQHLRRHRPLHERVNITATLHSVHSTLQPVPHVDCVDSVHSTLQPVPHVDSVDSVIKPAACDSQLPGVNSPRPASVRSTIKPRLHACVQCGKSFTRKQHLRRHFQLHERVQGATRRTSVNSPVKSEPCASVNAAGESSLSNSLTSAVESLCNSVFSCAAPTPCASAPCLSLRATMKPRLHKCMECGKSFTRRQHLRRHFQLHERVRDLNSAAACMPHAAVDCHVNPVPSASVRVKPRRYVCTECGKRFSRKQHLQRHFQLHQRLKDTNTCDSVNSAAACMPHDAVHVNPVPSASVRVKPRRYVCTECGKRFSRKQHLQRHFQLHQRVRGPGCCDSVNAALKTAPCHISFAVEPTPSDPVRSTVKPRRHKCTECGKCFTRKQHLRRHFQIHERGKVVTFPNSVQD